ncbi:acyl-CoA dehydrogenase family protein [Neobacillus sp. 114]|uniref:acyl-CoA dehydrogenase family protein n=1 Tax=Neobacillus sp. 114 TaxID=3048535 RepID=UPI001C24FE8D|nr:acyl-CoA dehydrogenase family protein [Neobacillus sp. 114]MBU8916823.1 acyl-CoA/acyl-ACP dehydrogenase [Bacillus sp. FJAT-29953]
MDFALNEEQLMFQETTRQFLESKGDLAIPRDYMNGKKQVLEDLWNGLGSLGFMGINISETYGGLGLGALSLVPILEEMGRSVVPGPYPETVAFAVPLLEAYGSAEQKEKYLPEIAAGKRKFSLALLEESGELSPSAIQLKAEQRGNEYVLQGKKILVPYADIVDTLIVPVRTGGTSQAEYGISLILVDCNQANLTMQELQSIDETRKLVNVSFQDVKVPNTQLLGMENGGWAILETGLNHLNAAFASTMVGGIERVVEMSTEYAKTRQQFGQPIGRFQAVKHRIVDMKLALESSRSLSYYASWAAENNAEELSEAVSMARSFISETYIKAAGANIQNHGGMGFTWEFDCHLFLKRARSLENHLGSPEYHREKIAVELGWSENVIPEILMS